MDPGAPWAGQGPCCDRQNILSLWARIKEQEETCVCTRPGLQKLPVLSAQLGAKVSPQQGQTAQTPGALDHCPEGSDRVGLLPTSRTTCSNQLPWEVLEVGGLLFQKITSVP